MRLKEAALYFLFLLLTAEPKYPLLTGYVNRFQAAAVCKKESLQ